MQASDLTKFRFAASIAGPYCSACNAGPAGPVGPTGPAGSAATWSQFPATQNVDMSCNLINDVSGINFCDGTYIGPGGSFDISSNDTVKILTGGANGIELVPGSGTTTISGSAGIAKLQLSTAGDTTVGSIRADDAEAAVLVETTADLYLNSGGSTYVKTTNATGNVLLQVDGDSEATLGSSQFQVASVTGNATVRVQAAGGKGGNITADEGIGSFVIEGLNGFGTTIQNDTLVSIAAAGLTSNIGMTTGAGETIVDMKSDGAGGGTIELKAETGGITPPLRLMLDGTNSNLVLDGTLTSSGNNFPVIFQSQSIGLVGNNWLKVLYNGSYIWIPFLDSDPSV